jgi:hypothetical protein
MSRYAQGSSHLRTLCHLLHWTATETLPIASGLSFTLTRLWTVLHSDSPLDSVLVSWRCCCTCRCLRLRCPAAKLVEGPAPQPRSRRQVQYSFLLGLFSKCATQQQKHLLTCRLPLCHAELPRLLSLKGAHCALSKGPPYMCFQGRPRAC